MILDNKTKSIEKCDIIGEHKINGIPNLYLRVNKTNKVFRLKAKKWLTLGIFGVDTSLRKADDEFTNYLASILKTFDLDPDIDNAYSNYVKLKEGKLLII